MSTSPEQDLDLEKLFLPAWAQEPASAKLYAKYEVEEDRFERRDTRRGQRGPRRDGPPKGDRHPGRPRHDKRPGPRPEGGQGKPLSGDRRDLRRREPRERRGPPAPLPELNLTLIPDEKGVESL